MFNVLVFHIFCGFEHVNNKKMPEDKARHLKGTSQTWSTPLFTDEEKLVQWNKQGTKPGDLSCFHLTSAINMVRDLKARFIFLVAILFTGKRNELDLVYICIIISVKPHKNLTS